MSKRVEAVLHEALRQVVAECRRNLAALEFNTGPNQISDPVIVVNEGILTIQGLARALRTERRHTAQEECLLPFTAEDW